MAYNISTTDAIIVVFARVWSKDFPQRFSTTASQQ
jgi:hypothetical protein